MINIKFIENRNIEFASRWRVELTPSTVATGKTISRFISNDIKTGKGKNVQKDTILLLKKYSSDEKKDLQNQWNNSKNKSSFRNIISDPWKTSVKSENKIKYVADRKKELLDDINRGLEKTQQKRATQPPRPKPNIKYKPLPKQEGVVKQLGKVLLKNRDKLGLGAVGLAATGALAYGLVRKARSDKGKKRGFYNR